MSMEKWIDAMIEKKKNQEKLCIPDNACLRFWEVISWRANKCLLWETCEKSRLHLSWKWMDVKEMPNYVIHNQWEEAIDTSQEEIDKIKESFFNSL